MSASDPALPPPRDRPDVSLVMVVYRTPELARRALDALEAASPALRYEVLVEDNAPVDDATERVCAGRPHVRYERNERNLGFGGGVNRGLARGSGRYYLVLNPDVEIAPGSLEALVRFADAAEDAGILAPRLHYADGRLQPSVRTFYTWPIFLLRRTFLGRLFPRARVLREHLMLDWDHENTRDVDWCIGGAMLVRREAVEDVGPMDERFFLYFEDVDWCYRMHQRGWRVVYVPAARMVHHYQRASAGGLWPRRSLWIHLESLIRFYEKWSFFLYWLKLRTALWRKLALFTSDLLAIVAAFAAAYWVRGLAADLLTKPMFEFAHYARFLGFAVVTTVLFFTLGGLYRVRTGASFIENVVPVTRAVTWSSAVMLASTYLFSDQLYSRAVVLLFFPLAILFVTAARTFWLRLLDSVRQRRLNLHRIGLLGPPAAVAEVLDRFARLGSYGMEPVAILGPGGQEEVSEPARVLRRLRQERVQELLVFEEWNGDLAGLVATLGRAAMPLRIVPRLRALLPSAVGLTTLHGLVAFSVGARTSRLRRSLGQRCFELCSGLAASALLVLPFALIALTRALRRRPVFETLRLPAPNGKPVDVRRLAGPSPTRSPLAALVAVTPSLPLLVTGAAGWTGLAPFPQAQLTDAELPAVEVPEAWVGLLGPWSIAPWTPQARIAWNRRYVQTWSPTEDLRILRDVFARRETTAGERQGA